jgi:hypothetical protein
MRHAAVPRIACLHTAPSNISLFEAEAERLGVRLVHAVRADLLEHAERAGGVSDTLRHDTVAALDALAAEAEMVLLTCSTLGACAVPPYLRTDAALARAAVQGGGRVAVLCAVETTLGPSRDLFENAAVATGARIDMHLVQGAWARFRAGDTPGYLAMLADSARVAQAGGASVVALAQASMAGATDLLPPDFPVLASPRAGLSAAILALNSIGAPS